MSQPRGSFSLLACSTFGHCRRRHRRHRRHRRRCRRRRRRRRCRRRRRRCLGCRLFDKAKMLTHAPN